MGMTVSPGQRVKVPFGRQTLTGLVVKTGVTPPDGITLKPILEVLEPWLALPTATFQLLSWASDYYQHPLGECLFTALPPALRRGRPSQQKQDEHWQGTQNIAPLPANAHRQKALLESIQRAPGISTGELVKAGFNRPQIKSLRDKGLIELSDPQHPTSSESIVTVDGPRLSPAQLAAAKELPQVTDRFSATLLYGITGSGKTE